MLPGLTTRGARGGRCASSILGDEMGLGKTLQMISFFAFLKTVRFNPAAADS